MHEFSIANQAADEIITNARNKKAKKIRSVEILIGELNLLGEEQLIFWIKKMLNSKGEIASDVRIDLKPVRAVIKCNHCGYEGNLEVKDQDHHSPKFYCPSCNQGDISIKRGKELVLNKIQIET
jgi:hydrogenase nickel insertion protein HypA